MPAKIMVVDNDPQMVTMMAEVLKAENYEVITAESGSQCLKKYQDNKPDLILLDAMMPGLSGWDIYWQIRKKDKYVKVAFVTVMEVSPERKKELIAEYGISDYIMKPFKPTELLETVKKILDGPEPKICGDKDFVSDSC